MITTKSSIVNTDIQSKDSFRPYETRIHFFFKSLCNTYTTISSLFFEFSLLISAISIENVKHIILNVKHIILNVKHIILNLAFKLKEYTST
jgi:hypothetical protein